jgi:hypothetical protein
VPVSAGDAIRVEVRTSPAGLEGGVDVASTRPLVLFSFLERFLRREGFATKFLFDSPGDGDMLYELSEQLEPIDDSDFSEEEEGSDRDGEIDTERDGKHEQDSGRDTGMSLLEVPRSDVDRWVNVCFGACRNGVEPEPLAADERVLLSDALEHFGHPAVALYLLGTHYSLPLGNTLTGLATGSKNASRIREALEKLVPDKPSPPDMRHYMEAFRDALANDLDTPLAFVVMFEWLLEAERRGGEVGDNDLRVMLEVLELEDLAAPVGTS